MTIVWLVLVAVIAWAGYDRRYRWTWLGWCALLGALGLAA